MKALAAALILSVLFLAFFVFKFIQHKRKYDKIYESFTIKPDPERITTQTLYEHGFRIHDTKSKVYAVHPNGVSLTFIEGTEWRVEIRYLGGITKSTAHYMGSLVEMCKYHKKPIQKQSETKD